MTMVAMPQQNEQVDGYKIDPVHVAALADLNQKDQVRYACLHAPQSKTEIVRRWLATYGYQLGRTYTSTNINMWRRENSIVSDTGELPVINPDGLAELHLRSEVDASTDQSGRVQPDEQGEVDASTSPQNVEPQCSPDLQDVAARRTHHLMQRRPYVLDNIAPTPSGDSYVNGHSEHVHHDAKPLNGIGEPWRPSLATMDGQTGTVDLSPLPLGETVHHLYGRSVDASTDAGSRPLNASTGTSERVDSWTNPVSGRVHTNDGAGALWTPEPGAGVGIPAPHADTDRDMAAFLSGRVHREGSDGVDASTPRSERVHRQRSQVRDVHEPGPVKGKARGTGPFYVVSILATLISMDTSFRFFHDVIGINGKLIILGVEAPWETIALFSIMEVALVACGWAMRANVRSPGGKPGWERVLAWAICGFSVYAAIMLSGLWVGIARVMLGSMLALVTLHLALGIEIRTHQPHRRGGIWQRIFGELRERFLSRLGLGDDQRTALMRTRDRARDRAARLATARFVLWRRSRVARAVRASGAALDAVRREDLIVQVAAYRNLGDLFRLERPSPWQ